MKTIFFILFFSPVICFGQCFTHQLSGDSLEYFTIENGIVTPKDTCPDLLKNYFWVEYACVDNELVSSIYGGCLLDDEKEISDFRIILGYLYSRDKARIEAICPNPKQ